MKKHQQTAGTYGLLGSVILLCVGTYRIGKSIYQKSKQNAKLNNDHHDLFV